MRNNIEILVAILFLTYSVTIDLSGQTIFNPEPFDGIYVTGNIEVKLEQGTENKVELYVEGLPDNKVVVKVQRGILRLRILDSWLYKGEVIKAYVTYKNLRTLKAMAGAIVESNTAIQTEVFDVRATSGSRIDLSVEVSSLEGGAAEGGVLALEGTTETQDILVSTGGQYNALDLSCKRSFVRANTGGRAAVNAIELLDAAANTGGIVKYNGNPEKTNVKTVIAGEVEKL